MGGLGGYSTATLADRLGGRYMDILTKAPAGKKQVLDVPAFYNPSILC
jgi:hypothetical protein